MHVVTCQWGGSNPGIRSARVLDINFVENLAVQINTVMLRKTDSQSMYSNISVTATSVPKQRKSDQPYISNQF